MGSEARAECGRGLVQQRSLTHTCTQSAPRVLLMMMMTPGCAARAPDRETTEVQARGVREGLRSTCCLRHDSALHGYVHIVPVNATQVLSFLLTLELIRLTENQSQPFKYLINAFLRLFKYKYWPVWTFIELFVFIQPLYCITSRFCIIVYSNLCTFSLIGLLYLAIYLFSSIEHLSFV